MTAAQWTLTEFSAGQIADRPAFATQLRLAFLAAGFTSVNNISTNPTTQLIQFDVSRSYNNRARGTQFLRITLPSTDTGSLYQTFSTAYSDFSRLSPSRPNHTWITRYPSTAIKFLSVNHPEANIVHVYSTGDLTAQSHAGIIRPLQIPSFINEDIYPYGIHVSGQSNNRFTTIGEATAINNAYHPASDIGSIFTPTTSFQNSDTFNFVSAQRELYPSIVFRTNRGWFGTTSADICYASYILPGDKLILPSGAQYLACVPFFGGAIRI